jgi:hypothetical protein
MRWSYIGAALFTVLAILGALGRLWLPPTVAVLTLTLIAIISYTAFAYQTARQTQQTGRLTEQLAAIESSRVREERVHILPELKTVVGQVQEKLEKFLSSDVVERWAEGRDLDHRPGVAPVHRALFEKGRPLAAKQREEVRQPVVRAFALAEDALRSWRRSHNGLSADQAKDLVAQVRAAKEAADEAVVAVLNAIRDGG